jgi:bacterioferritin-associated ferredoxin
MYVCLCNGLSDRQVKCAAQAERCTVADVYRALGKRAVCGMCAPMVRDIIRGVPTMRLGLTDQRSPA